MKSGQPVALTSEPLRIFYYDVFNGRPLLIAWDARGQKWSSDCFWFSKKNKKKRGDVHRHNDETMGHNFDSRSHLKIALFDRVSVDRSDNVKIRLYLPDADAERRMPQPNG